MSQVENSLLIQSLNKQPTPRAPVWLMRQAGRYLPEYRAIRSKVPKFLDVCKTPELACEVAMQPLRRFKLDAAIVFSDILTIPDAFGLGLDFIEGVGPVFERRIATPKDIARLDPQTLPEKLTYVSEAVKLLRQEMPADLPLIGFAGSPWTLACYMVEGKSSRDFSKMMVMMYDEPESTHQLLQKLTSAVCTYLEAQINAGANVIMLFDTWGGLLGAQNFITFSLNYMQNIVKYLKEKHPHIPIIIFTKNNNQCLVEVSNTGCNAISLDAHCDLKRAKDVLSHKVALQGNLDPNILLTRPDTIRKHVLQILNILGNVNGFIFNLGHGITPDVDPDNVTVMIETIHEYYPRKSS
jgi:uroporphyrinogen decarboxylase